MPQTVRVILPVYNEAAIAARVAAEVVAFARGMGNDWHFVFVDDGSTDGTAAILADSLAAEPTSRVKLLALGENYGKGQAIERGIEGATEDIIVFTDGDLAYSLDLIPEFVRGLLTHEIVIGSRDLAYAQARREGRPCLRERPPCDAGSWEGLLISCPEWFWAWDIPTRRRASRLFGGMWQWTFFRRAKCMDSDSTRKSFSLPPNVAIP
ncbi:glycosyltransferase family 2 protein [Oscillatoria amoena NRMC-F 0135]|nr:glycosyltransferase family 2 protein [Oscillatoria amoena NRMC-F 0135]